MHESFTLFSRQVAVGLGIGRGNLEELWQEVMFSSSLSVREKAKQL